jgi:glycerol-3-phosphate dehydrogenase (NAD(P)+)
MKRGTLMIQPIWVIYCGYSVFSETGCLEMIGKGCTVKSAMMEMSMVSEGYYA